MASKLILMRHGQSVWNKKNLFTGWVDVPLSEQGIQEALKGGEKIKNIPIDVVFTSSLIRAQMTALLALLHHQTGKIPVFQQEDKGDRKSWGDVYSDETREGIWPAYKAWELNERMYGKLQGMNKEDMKSKFGEEQIQIWRRSFDAIPPDGESLQMTIERSLPYFQRWVVPLLDRGRNIFIVAHGNSLRGIVMHLEDLSTEEVVQLEIPTGEPLIYSYEEGRWIRD